MQGKSNHVIKRIEGNSYLASTAYQIGVNHMVKCPMCGTEVKNPEKTWQLVAPLPDAEGRITITVMGVFKCPNCGYRWKTKVSTLKVGPEGEVEIETRKRRKRRKEERKEPKPSGPIIEVDISDIIKEEL